MEKSDKCKIKISIPDGLFEISGNEKFVKKQIKNFQIYLDEMLESAINYHDEEDWDLDLSPTSEYIFDDEDDYETEDYEDENFEGFLTENEIQEEIFDLNEDDILVVGEVPGDEPEERTVNAALLYLYARELQGAEEAEVKQIKKLVKIHGFYDKNNFDTYLNSAIKKYYNFTDADTNTHLKLYKKGREKATKLIEDIKFS